MKLPQTILKREDFGDVKESWLDRLFRPLNTQFKSLSSILNGGLVLADNFAAFTKTMDVTLRDDWTALTLSNAWTILGGSYESPAYRKVGDRVELRGLAAAGTLTAELATLPTACRPSKTRTFATVCDTASTTVTARVDVTATGAITTANAPAGMTWVSLEGIAFDASDRRPVANGSFPIRFHNDLPGLAKPSGVLVLSVADTTGTGSTPAVCSIPAWRTDGDQIVISDVAGLAAGRRYRLTMLVVV